MDKVYAPSELERRIYELARKHCGRQASWSISLDTLLKKSGSQSSIKRFRQHVKEIAAVASAGRVAGEDILSWASPEGGPTILMMELPAGIGQDRVPVATLVKIVPWTILGSVMIKSCR